MQASNSFEPMPMTPPIMLRLRGSHVPSFKNSKMLVTLGKRTVPITKTEHKKWMEAAVLDFVSQLSSELRTRGIEITTAPSPLSLTASLLPLDDSRKWIPEHSVSTQIVSIESDAGCDITIERIE
jgi:hypothetical protein